MPSTSSIFNHVIGPIMRGPSSSHTAGAHHIARVAASLLGEQPRRVRVTFDPGGSYATCYREQGADIAFACGLLDRPLHSDRYFDALTDLAEVGATLVFAVEPLRDVGHPNDMGIDIAGYRHHVLLRAQSVGGGAIRVTEVNGWRVDLDGGSHVLMLSCAPEAAEAIASSSSRPGDRMHVAQHAAGSLVVIESPRPWPPGAQAVVAGDPAIAEVWTVKPVFYPTQGPPLFGTAEEMVSAAEQFHDLGDLAAEYESKLLGMSREAVLHEAGRRLRVMEQSVAEGLRHGDHPMQLLSASAGDVMRAEAQGILPAGGMPARAAARALSVMHVNGGMGVVCAAPTAGSAGVIPAVLVTMMEDMRVPRQRAMLSLMAAGAVGVVVSNRATFAAEVAGCQVEIGAAGAMAAAAVVDAMGGTAQQAIDAAAIAFQNTMGSVCDLVQGVVEIPCHTRNAVAASSAFVCADLAVGGYRNPVPLDETIDAVYAVGRMLPCELRCTARGGLATAPSALALPRRDVRKDRET